MLLNFVRATTTAALLFCAIATPGNAQNATSGGNQAIERANVTLNVRLKVEGDPTTLTTGINLECRLTYLNDIGSPIIRRQETVILPNGALFSPQTPDGFIEASVTFQNINFANDLKYSADNFYYWRCDAVPIDKSQATVFVASRVAIPPAQIGSCPSAGGRLLQDGTEFSSSLSCAEFNR